MIVQLWTKKWQVTVSERVVLIGYSNRELMTWLRENCRDEWYFNPTWKGISIQFVDEKDAILFALRWS